MVPVWFLPKEVVLLIISMKDEIITLSYGSGGKLTSRFINDYILKNFGNKILNKLTDSAIVPRKIVNGKIAFTIDGFTVNPIFFPGGDIGKLSVCGTVNDLVAVGAKPLFIGCSFIIQEGLEGGVLRKIIFSMRKVCKREKVEVVCGDTKVVEKNACDKIFIITSGIGAVDKRFNLSYERINPSDKIIITGNIAEHGFATLLARGSYGFSYNIKSDCTPLWRLIKKLIPFSSGIKFMRDPTRGGIAAVLNEVVNFNERIGIKIFEKDIPMSGSVRSVSEILGIDPLTVANEGKMIIVVNNKLAEKVLTVLREHPLGKDAKIIGEVVSEYKGKVVLENVYGSRRIVEMPSAEQLPRIC